MNSSECWIGWHENCWDADTCACVCHSEGYTWADADVRRYIQ
jgi:hypothetical protein